MTTYEHVDQLGQAIQVGDYVALTYYHSRRVSVGQVLRLTKQRVRIAFVNRWEYKGEIHSFETKHIARPEDIVVLSKDLQQHLTMAKLQKKI